MGLSILRLLLAASSASLVTAFPKTSYPQTNSRYILETGGIKYTVFEHEATATRLSYVKNSGICETTQGVNQYSGYLSAGHEMNMFFWFFESRNRPSDAPLALWLNGGPGCSSLIGLFQENGPCHFVDGQLETNPHSWNNYANMIYVDQPIGTGFSYGTDHATSTVTAAKYVWKLLQNFYAAFPDYKSRDFGLFTESYGGHYGPKFVSFFQTQNSKIESGKLKGEKINIVALGINNGWTDPAMIFKGYVDYAYNNTYRRLITESQYSSLMTAYETICEPAMKKCKGLKGNNDDCLNAMNVCTSEVNNPIQYAPGNDFDVYDIRSPSNDPNPPGDFYQYLTHPDVVKAIGANATFEGCDDDAYAKIYGTGDMARSFLDTLSTVVQSGITVLIWAGDADWICNWNSNYDVVHAIQYSGTAGFASAQLQNYTVDGKVYGEYKTAENLSWLKVFGAGHEVPFYPDIQAEPEVSLQAFTQTMKRKPLSAT